jgi:hypothetical protein
VTTAEIIHGDCLDVMPALDAASVDAIVSDPPYGLGFMGKAWDHGVPGEAFWREALRVAKPGAHLVAFGGTRTYHRLTVAIEDAGWEIRDCLSWLYGSGFPKSHNGPWGGTALKPAWEPIILARKPLAGTVAANVQAHGTGALNIDATRIRYEPEDWTESKRRIGSQEGRAYGASGNVAMSGGHLAPLNPSGRWPANVCLDEDAAALLDAQAPDTGAAAAASGPTLRGETHGTVAYGARKGLDGDPAFHGDRGGASRFYYTAKASRKERGVGNDHPTVKPLALMRWLCRLVTPPGGLILDPFTGSGSTGCAALAEGFRFLGIERDAHYAEIARTRLASVPQLSLPAA